MDEITKIKQELERTKMELGILYEISNAMRTTLKLDEILYIILTGVTAHLGLGFNRAILFLVNTEENCIEGKMAIGPENGEEANRIWTQIEQERIGLDDLIAAYNASDAAVDNDTSQYDSDHKIQSGFNKQVKRLKVLLEEQKGGFLALGVLDGIPLHLNKETIQKYQNDPILKMLKTNELVAVPLKTKDKVNGVILADNFITNKPITKDDLRMLIMLANQAGLAIENSQLYEKTAIHAHTDYLTELWNHGYFQYLLQRELEKAKNIKMPLALMMLDIDDFKVYNDILGHQAGDKILRELSSVLKNQSRRIDYVCRYGGEEFTIILPQTDKKEAFLIAERLRENIKNHQFTHAEVLPSKQLTVSIGLSIFPEDGALPSELITCSDKALYQAKHKGKNNSCCY